MTVRTIPGKKPVFSASAVREAIATELSLIKVQDGLTFDDLGRVLGKSADQAAKYCDGTAEMGAVAFGAAKREWNGRFTGAFDRLCVESRPGTGDDRSKGTLLLKAALALSVALEATGEIDPRVVRDNRAALENGRDAIEEVLNSLVRAAS